MLAGTRHLAQVVAELRVHGKEVEPMNAALKQYVELVPKVLLRVVAALDGLLVATGVNIEHDAAAAILDRGTDDHARDVEIEALDGVNGAALAQRVGLFGPRPVAQAFAFLGLGLVVPRHVEELAARLKRLTSREVVIERHRHPLGTVLVNLDLPDLIAILGQRLTGIAPVIGGKNAREAMNIVIDHAAGLVKGDSPVLNSRLEVKGRVEDANLIRDVAVTAVVLGNGPDACARGKLLDPLHDRVAGIDAELMAEVNVGDGTGLATKTGLTGSPNSLTMRETAFWEQLLKDCGVRLLRATQHLVGIVNGNDHASALEDVHEHVARAAISLVALVEQKVCLVDEGDVNGIGREVLAVQAATVTVLAVLVDELRGLLDDDARLLLEAKAHHDGVVNRCLLGVVDDEVGLVMLASPTIVHAELIGDLVEQVADEHRLASAGGTLHEDERAGVRLRVKGGMDLGDDGLLCRALLIAQAMEGRGLEDGRVPDCRLRREELGLVAIELAPCLGHQARKLVMGVVVVLRVTA